MKVEQLSLKDDSWSTDIDRIEIKPTLILLFVSLTFKSKTLLLTELNKRFPEASIIGCATAGEINGDYVNDSTVSLTAITFNKVTCKLASHNLSDFSESYDSGRALATQLEHKDLSHVLVFSHGVDVNGSEIVAGLKSELPNTSITGGLAGYNVETKDSFVIANTSMASKQIVGVGLYGDALNVGYGSNGGWDSFGIDRLVTKSNKNVVYELDGTPALAIYKSFLGEDRYNIPDVGLSFPFSMRVNEYDSTVVRTVRRVIEEDQSLVFAANVPKGSTLRLMKSNVDRLINGAGDSAIKAISQTKHKPKLAILVSCIGRRLLLKQLVEEEVEAVGEVLGDDVKVTGFYSFGEIAPADQYSRCELHNQTMTITTLSEC